MDEKDSLISSERARKERQLLISLEKLGYHDLNGWEVITTLSATNHFYTRFANESLKLKAKSIKWIVEYHGKQPNNDSGKQPDDDSDKMCNICQNIEYNGHKFKCSHWHCYDCLNNYLKCEPDFLLDPEYHDVICPTCKTENNRTLIDYNELNKIAIDSNGVIPNKTLEDLGSLMVKLSLKGEDIYCCIDQKCSGKWTLQDLENEIHNKFEIRCPICLLHQCSKCNIPWKIHGNNCSSEPIDSQTVEYLLENCVKCPGKCGQYIQKDDTGGVEFCNVLKCYIDKIYVCGLCGEKLDSVDFNIYDNNHNRANIHFWEGPKSCRQHLFTPRKKWLSLQNKNKSSA